MAPGRQCKLYVPLTAHGLLVVCNETDVGDTHVISSYIVFLLNLKKLVVYSLI